MTTYWLSYPRSFADEYEIGIATNDSAAWDFYSPPKFEKITRRHAETMIRLTSHADGEIDCVVSLNGKSLVPPEEGFLELLR